MQQGALNTSRISIRGIGSLLPVWNPENKTYFEGIPLTNAEGESTIEDIEMETIKHRNHQRTNSTSFGSGFGVL
jgi:iron complex outermembrane receptor protein